MQVTLAAPSVSFAIEAGVSNVLTSPLARELSMPRTAPVESTCVPSTARVHPARGRVSFEAAPGGLVPTSLETLETTSQESSERWVASGSPDPELPLRFKICKALDESEVATLQKRALRISDCCQHPLVCEDQEGRARVIWQQCRDRLCPGCQRRRGMILTTRVTAMIQKWSAVRMVTLTKKHTGQTLPMMLDEVAESFKNLRRTQWWRSCVKGGVYVFEVTRGTHGEAWHAHVHVLCNGTFLDQKRLSAEWLKATGDSPICHVKYIHQRETGASYVAKYVGKPTGMEHWNGSEITEFAVAVHRRRLVHTFGKGHGASPAAIDEREDTKVTGHVCSVRDFQRAAEQGHKEAAWALERLKAAYLNPKATRVKVDDLDLRRIAQIGHALYGVRAILPEEKVSMPDELRQDESPPAVPPPPLIGTLFEHGRLL